MRRGSPLTERPARRVAGTTGRDFELSGIVARVTGALHQDAPPATYTRGRRPAVDGWASRSPRRDLSGLAHEMGAGRFEGADWAGHGDVTPPGFAGTGLGDPVLPEALAEFAAARAAAMDAGTTVNRELSIARKAIVWRQRQGWIACDPTLGYRAPSRAAGQNVVKMLINRRPEQKRSGASTSRTCTRPTTGPYPRQGRRHAAAPPHHWPAVAARSSSSAAAHPQGRRPWTCVPKPAGPPALRPRDRGLRLLHPTAGQPARPAGGCRRPGGFTLHRLRRSPVT